MASRDKKSTVGRKQATTASPQITQAREESDASNGEKPLEEKRKPGQRKRAPPAVAKGVKRTITLKSKSRNMKISLPTLLSKGAKRDPVQKKAALIKNGGAVPAAAVIRKRPLSLRERIIPPTPKDATVSVNDRQKRRIKQEPVEFEEAQPPAIKPAATKGNKRMKKVKDSENDSLHEEVLIKKEPEEEESEIESKEAPKKSRSSKKAKSSPTTLVVTPSIEDENNEEVKQENIDAPVETTDDTNILHKVDVSDSNVIDCLNLDVAKVKKTDAFRRHSIEKFPVTINDVKVRDDSALIVNLPKAAAMKALKRPARPRPNSESKAKPPALQSGRSGRILRNGKTRRLQQYPLFDGLDSEYKMRRRLASDFSGSEVSKISGYESDSSLSSSLLETTAASVDKETEDDASPVPPKEVLEADKVKELQLKKEILETLENNQPDTEEGKQIVENVSAAIKRSLSMEASSATATTGSAQESERDTNSNLTAKSEPTTPIKSDFVSDVPKLLGIMKQAFNDKGVTITEEIPEVARRKTRSSMRKTKSPEKEPQKEAAPLPATTISTLTAVGIALGPDITVTAEEVQDKEMVKNQNVPEPMDQDTVEDAEAELINILAQRDNKTKSPKSTPSTSVNGGSPMNENKGSSPTGDESPESLAEKSQILKALGLQTLQEAEEARKKQVPKADNYTGTLKTVIKLNRCADKKKPARNPIKMTLQKKGRSTGNKDNADKVDEDEYKIMQEGTSWKHHGGQSSDTAGAQRKSHYSNRSNMDGSSEHTSDGDTNQNEEGAAPGKLLVIPEKASSFSIHPGRLCKDECCYCFGKFGLFDTPLHIAQIKAVERQDKILANEKHLTRDSCLCDACYRHVDRKVNMFSYMSKSVKRNALIAPAPRQNHCYVLGCNEVATNILKRKWLIKMRKAVCQVINIDLDNPGLHSIPTCKEHYAAVEHLMVCAMCKRRLARNHIHYMGSESNELQNSLNIMGIPVKLNEKPVVCKLCRYFATLVLKSGEEFSDDAQTFFMDYKKRLLHFHNVETMEDCETTEPILAPMKHQDKCDASSKKRKRRHNLDPPVLEPQIDIHSDEPNDAVPSSESRPESPCDYAVDYRNLIPNIAIECLNDVEITKKQSQNSTLSIRRISKAEAQEKKRMRSDIAVQRLGSNPSISIRQMFPGEEDVPLNGHIDFQNVKERTPEGWEKCTSTIQYDPDTKQLWQELQKPYGNQSSFLRHLVLLEKYFRNGDLVLSPRAGNLSVSYTESVQNRLRAYDNISSAAGSVQPLTMLPFNNPKMSFNAPGELSGMKQAENPIEKMEKLQTSLIDKMQTSIIPMAMSTPNASVVVNNAQLPKNIPLTLAQATTIANASIVPTPAVPLVVPTIPPVPRSESPARLLPITATPTPPPQPPSVTATVTTVPTTKSKPPGLISLQQASKLPGNASNKPQSQKIKFPITKNWRPKLIPIDPSAKPEKKPGLVQVISGGKPYHITMEDYKKMCAIKRTYDLRQKRLQETMKSGTTANPNSLLKSTANKLKNNKSPITSDQEENNSMDDLKFDKSESKAITITPSLPLSVDNKMPMNLPKIPKSLTVIPQTVTITNKSRSRPSSPNQNAKSAKAHS